MSTQQPTPGAAPAHAAEPRPHPEPVPRIPDDRVAARPVHPWPGRRERAERADPESLLYADHGRPGAFFAPWRRFDKSFVDLLRWRFRRSAWDKSREPDVPRIDNDGAHLAAHEPDGAVTWIGHASFAVHEGDEVVLTDPHFGPRALLPRRHQSPGVPLEAVSGAAFAVLSHNHYDHLDAWTVERLPEDLEWLVPLGTGKWFRRHGRRRVTELDWWESVHLGRFEATFLPVQHWSNRISQRKNGALWGAWLLDSGERRYFFGGDSGYFYGFAELGRVLAPIDVALLPIGAFAPRWFMRYQHMSPDEAVDAFVELGARFLLPAHWGTFDLSDEPLDLPPQLLRRAAREAGVDDRTVPLAIGERWPVPPREAAGGKRTDERPTGSP